MTARVSMADLIAKTRTLIADTGTPSVFSDEEIQDALDRRRTEQRHIALTPSPTFTAGGRVFFFDFYAGVEYWEDDLVLQDAAYNVVTPDAPEPIVGHWHFATQPQGFGVRATGKTYDVYGSAADVLESWAAKQALQFDFTDSKSQYMRSQKFDALQKLAASYRSRALASSTIAVQSDGSPEAGSSPAVTYPTYTDDFGW